MNLDRDDSRYPIRVAAAVVATFAVLSTLGCRVNPMNSTNTDATTTANQQALDELRKLPSLEDATVQVHAVMVEVTTAITEILPGAVWVSRTDTGGFRSCGDPYADLGARHNREPDMFAVRIDVSEQDWARIQDIASTAAAKMGATAVEVMANAPGNHDVWFEGPAGSSLKVGYAGNLVVSGDTGCRLPAAPTTTTSAPPA